MSLPALVQTKAELRRLGVAGAALAARDPKLSRLSGVLDKAGARAPVFAKLAQGLNALTAAPEEAAGGLLIRPFSLARAVQSTQAKAAPEGELRPVPARSSGKPSGKHSSRLLSALRAALSTSGPGRLETLKQAPGALMDLRIAHLLPAALDDTPIAEFVEEQLIAQADASTVDAVEGSLSGAPAADARRLAIISQADKARGRALARRLLDEKPKPALKAQIFRSLADDPDALELLLGGAAKGALDAKKAAMSALAERSEPEAIAAIAAQLGKPGKQREVYLHPMSFELLEEAFHHITAPGLRQTMQDALLDEQIPIDDTNERWSRVDWAEALAACPADDASVAALTTACKAGWAPASAVALVARQAPLEWLKRLITAKARARMDGQTKAAKGARALDFHASHRTRDLLLTAAARLPAEELYELLSPGFAKDKGLQEAMIQWRQHGYWRNGSGARIVRAVNPRSGSLITLLSTAEGEQRAGTPIRWDARWLQDAVRQQRPYVAAALAGPEDIAVGPMLLDRLPGLPPEETSPILEALSRISHPETGAATLATIDRLLLDEEKETRMSWSKHSALVDMLALLGPGEVQGLKALISAPAHTKLQRWFRESLEGRLDALEEEAFERRRAIAAATPNT